MLRDFATIAIILTVIIFFGIVLSKQVQKNYEDQRSNFMDCIEKIDDTQWCYDAFITSK